MEIKKLTDEISTMVSKVPRKVLNGDARTAQDWRELALEAFKLIRTPRPSLKKLNEYHGRLAAFL